MTEKLAEVLHAWIEDGFVKPRYQDWINGLQRSDSWYSRILKEKGKEAADAVAEERVRVSRLKEYSSGVEAVALGMLAFAKVDTKGEMAKLVSISGNRYPRDFGVDGAAQIAVIFNPNPGGCSCDKQPDDVWEFFPGGVLGLAAVTLEANAFGPYLGLVLTPKSYTPTSNTVNGYTVVSVDRKGFVHKNTFTREDEIELSSESLLRCNLGLEEAPEGIRSGCHSGGDFDQSMGFPGAFDYFATALPRLGKYYSQLAEKFAKHADH